MKKVKIEYSTPYADYNKINGYIMANDCGDYYEINKNQLKRAYNNLTTGGDIAPCYHTDKPIFVKYIIKI